MAELDANLMDVDEQDQSSHHTEWNKNICIDNLVCDEKADQEVQVTKEEMHRLLDVLDLGKWAWVPQDDHGGPKNCRFH